MSDAMDNVHFLYRRHQFDPAGEATCLVCRRTFATAAIRRWIDGGTTPICPRCRFDFVVPGRLSEDAIARARAQIFAPMEGMEPLQPGDWT